MNRKEEYQNLIAELDKTPAALDYSVTRAKARAGKEKKIRRLFTIPTSGIIVFFIAFAVSVNISMPFAMACGRIPLIRELALAVAFSPSLSAAVDNEYVQPIEIKQTQNDITICVEYVIVDQKQLNIFYTLQSQVYNEIGADTSIGKPDGTELEGYSLSSGSPVVEKGELRHVVADFVDLDVPGSIMFTCKVYDRSMTSAREPVQVDMFNTQHSEYKEKDCVADFSLVLEFEPYYTQLGEVITLNESVLLDGQKITVETVEIYPTHMRLNLMDDENNTAWLKALSFYFENESGERFEPISNGITATGSADSTMMRSYRLESSFFSNSKELYLNITDVVWLDKKMERIKVDLANAIAEKLPQGVRLEYARRMTGGWELEFSGTEREENHMYQLFTSSYYDESGNEYSISSWSTRDGYYNGETEGNTDEAVRFLELFALVGYYDDTVYLSPAFSRTTVLNETVVVKVK